ncbi:hypothetical protein O3G_MSEX007845 [Manduca sexta]|nr:hypothetical protein O3G_MSEX007845 [Manduca sexta]
MHTQNFTTQMCRQVPVGEPVPEGQWGEELLDSDSKIAAIVAQLAQHSRASHHQPHHKVQTVRSDVDASVILDGSMRLFNAQSLDQPESIVVHVPTLPPLPPLQEMKRCQETAWFNNKTKTVVPLKDDTPMLGESDSSVLELGPGASPAQHKQHNKKSLPHKKRISRKLKKNNGSSTPQQGIVVINCNEDVQHEEILPDNFVTAVQHQEQLPEDTHHITHEVRAILLCQLCGEFYGEDQLKFYHHLKQHYEPQAIIIDNPVPDLAIDKITNTCIVDNVATLPDSIVELSLENTVPKTVYQSIDKHILYTSSDKTLNYASNKVQYSMASMDKEPHTVDKADLYDTLDKLELYNCAKCNKTFRKQKQFEAHVKEAHSNTKLEDMGEFSEPEDLMEGIHVTVDVDAEQPDRSHPGADPTDPDYDLALLPHLTVENGHVHQDHVRHWYLRGGSCGGSCGGAGCGAGCGAACGSACAPGDAYCAVCNVPPPHTNTQTNTTHTMTITNPPREHEQPAMKMILKEEVLQRILDTSVNNEHVIPDNVMVTEDPPPPSESQPTTKTSKKKGTKKYSCGQCGRVFDHRSSLLYHVLSHGGRQQVCRDCGKGFYTAGALKIHRRVHNGDRPYKCDVCGRDFRQWSDLTYHKAIHSKQKCFKCEFCGKEFARKYSLNVHRRIHTGERNYKCEYCNKSFRASSYRLSHMRTHTDDRPYKCDQCDKCFRVAFDLRRHFLTHEKARNRFEQQKTKIKEEKEGEKPEEDTKEPPPKVKKIAVASTTRLPTILKVDKKQKPSKKNAKKGAPNVTVGQTNGEFKLNSEYTNNVEVFDTRQEGYNKFKDVYNEYKETFKQPGDFKEEDTDRDFAILKPMLQRNALEPDKPVYARTENTDGKMQIYTHVEKKEYASPIVQNSQVLGDARHMEREVRSDMTADGIEHGFLERLTALYNIPAV